MNDYRRVPSELKELNQWVGATNDTKVPLDIIRYKNASSTDPDTWCDYKTALTYYDHGFIDYLGFVFNDNGIVGIDIDDGYEDGLISKLACDIINKCQSYTEKSRSGRGFHILVKGDIPFSGKNNLNGVEIYKASRFFIMTGDVFIYDKMVENQRAIDEIIDTYFQAERESSEAEHPRIYRPIWEAQKGKIPIRPKYPPILEGSRNICLTSLAGSLHAQGYEPAEIFNEVTACNNQACDPPLDDEEIINIVNSVIKYRRGMEYDKNEEMEK